MQRRYLAILFSLLTPTGLCATESRPVFQQQQLDVSYGYHRLNEGLGEWRDVDLSWLATLHNNDSIYVTSRTLHRFGYEDRNYQLGGYLRLGSSTSVQIEIAQSELQLLLPKASWLVDLSQSLGQGWVIAVALKDAQFDQQSGAERSTQLLRFGVEKYLGNYRLVLQHYANQSDETTTRSNALQLHRYYPNRHSLFLSLSQGDELDFDPQVGLIPIEVSALTLGGTYWYDERWAIYSNLQSNQVKTKNFAYQRDGLLLGLRYLF